MNILMTIHRYWPSIGGTEAFVEGLARALVQRGHAVTIATSDEPGAPASEERGGVRIRRFTLKRLGKYRFPPKAYRDFVRSGGWDVVVCHGQRVWSTDYVHDIAHKSRTPFVLMAHGFYQKHMGKLRPAEWVYYHKALPFGFAKRHAVAETHGEVDELESFGFDRSRVAVITSAFDPVEFARPVHGFRAKYGIAPDEPILLYVGGFYVNKRVDDVVRIAARTRTRAIVIGRDADPQERGLKSARALATRLGARVDLLGKIPREDVLSAYFESTLFLLASKFEGYGLVLLEAMAAGLPFIATRAGAAPDLAALGGGVSVPTWEDMAREASRLLADEPTRRAMGEAGKRHAGDFTQARIASEHEALYARAIREQRTVP